MKNDQNVLTQVNIRNTHELLKNALYFSEIIKGFRRWPTSYHGLHVRCKSDKGFHGSIWPIAASMIDEPMPAIAGDSRIQRCILVVPNHFYKMSTCSM